MSYSEGVCLAALGHVTREQVFRMHYLTASVNPELYAWAQFRAASAAPPPAAMLATGATPDACRTTSKGCACAANWALSGSNYTYCAQLGSSYSSSYSNSYSSSPSYSSTRLYCKVGAVLPGHTCIPGLQLAAPGSTCCTCVLHATQL